VDAGKQRAVSGNRYYISQQSPKEIHSESSGRIIGGTARNFKGYSFFLKPSDAEFMQNRWPVGRGPSGKT
jgi:hypothetical protein